MRAAPHLLVISGFWPTRDNPISGIFVPQQVASLAQRKVHITVVVAETIWRRRGGVCSLEELGLDYENVRLVVVPVLRLPEKISSLPGGVRFNAWLYQHALRKAIGKLAAVLAIDACVIHGLRYAAFVLPAWRHLITGKVAAVVHGVDPFLERSNVQGQLASLVSKMNLKVDDYVLVGSPLQKHAKKLGLPSSKITIIGNGTIIPEKSTLPLRKRMAVDSCNILSVANLVPLKGLDDNLRALSLLTTSRPDLRWHYRVVGDGPFRDSLERLANELGIADRVEFLGRLSYEETMLEMNNTDIFSLPSWGEAFGIVYLEAMARMKPVIGCFDNGAADIVTQGIDGFLIKPRAINELADTLALLIADPELSERVGQAARLTAEGYSWNMNADRYLACLGLRCS